MVQDVRGEGAEKYAGKLTLRGDDHLVETHRNVLITTHGSIGGVALAKLGHDRRAAQEMAKRRY